MRMGLQNPVPEVSTRPGHSTQDSEPPVNPGWFNHNRLPPYLVDHLKGRAYAPNPWILSRVD